MPFKAILQVFGLLSGLACTRAMPTMLVQKYLRVKHVVLAPRMYDHFRIEVFPHLVLGLVMNENKYELLFKFLMMKPP